MRRNLFCYTASAVLFAAALASCIFSVIIVIKANDAFALACSCQNGTDGLPGDNDTCVCCPEPVGSSSIIRTQDLNTVVGSAQYVNTALFPGNNNRDSGDPFRFRSPAVYNSLPTDITDMINNAGTIFSLSTGTYELVYGTSLTSQGSLCIYNGSSVGSMSPMLESMVGSKVPNSWIHGNYIVQCNSVPCYIKLAPYNSTNLAVSIAPSLSSSTGAMIQISILKLY